MTSTTEGVAAIDCGTNTIRLLIAGAGQGHRESRIVRLGQGVDATGRLDESALARTFAALDDYVAIIRSQGVTRVRMCATSAVRDAANGSVLVDGVVARLGVAPDVLTGEEEAALTYDGAVRRLTGPAPEPVVVVDIGGGSTELVTSAGGHSMDIGAVRLHERHLHSDPPTAAEVAACVADVDAHLDAQPVALATAGTLVGVAGTSLSLAAGVLGLTAYDADVVDQARLPVREVRELVDRLVAMPLAARRELGWLDPGRADVIGAGALILARVLARTRVRTLVASEGDILDGIAASIV